MGLSGVPIFNVNNNCSTGSSALMIARNFVMGGVYQCALALGFEKMERNLSQKVSLSMFAFANSSSPPVHRCWIY